MFRIIYLPYRHQRGVLCLITETLQRSAGNYKISVISQSNKWLIIVSEPVLPPSNCGSKLGKLIPVKKLNVQPETDIELELLIKDINFILFITTYNFYIFVLVFMNVIIIRTLAT